MRIMGGLDIFMYKIGSVMNYETRVGARYIQETVNDGRGDPPAIVWYGTIPENDEKYLKLCCCRRRI
jgi:hypothetical protein